MDKKNIQNIMIFLVPITLLSDVNAQLTLKRDDFMGTGAAARKHWWRYHDEGTGQFPTPEGGYLRITLHDADASLNEYCNSGIWDGANIYTNVKIQVRARAITPAYPGTRGWGLWYSEPFTMNPLMHNAWFMQQSDIPEGDPEDIYWRAQVSRGINWQYHHFVNLDDIADISDWHFYEVTRSLNPALVTLSIDGNLVLSVNQNIPTANFSFHTWIDNQLYHIPEGSTQWMIYRRSFEGTSETLIDFVQILTGDSTAVPSTPGGNVVLRKIPNEMGDGTPQSLWKEYFFDSPVMNAVLLVTARAEDYGIYGDDDDIKIILDDEDFGWDTEYSFDGQSMQDGAKTVRIARSLNSGMHTLKLMGDMTPLLYDVTVVGRNGGGVIFDHEYNETSPGGTNYEWKTINFLTWGGEVTVYVSGTADEDPNPTGYGRTYSRYNDNLDDDLRIELDNHNYGYFTERSLYGNRLFGEPKSILITDTLSRGQHTLKIFSNNSPTLYRVLIYGENDDVSLPVTLSQFDLIITPRSNRLEWTTESEINNLGFNVYKAVSSEENPEAELSFFKINDRLINGAGNSPAFHEYVFEDENVQDGYYYWYQLEDIDFNGNPVRHDIKKLFRADNSIKNSVIIASYPNPFNLTTRIDYELKKNTSVKWKIYSVNGTMINFDDLGTQEKGKSSVFWSGLNRKGQQVPSGIYYFQLVTSVGAHTIKMVLCK